MKILLVDDSRPIRDIWKKVIAHIENSEVIEAGDGLEGLTAMSEHGPFDMMLIDWNMPNMNGLDMVKKVREKDKQTLIMMVTTEAEKPHIIDVNKCIKCSICYQICPVEGKAVYKTSEGKQ